MSNPNFSPEYSSNTIFYDTDMSECLTDHIDNMASNISNLQSSKANVSHVHPEYASISHLHSYNDLTDKPTTSTSSLVDSISEEGASGNWTYRKWENGVSEAWYYESLGEIELRSLSSFGVWSNDSYNARNIDFPSNLFNSTPMAVCNVYSNGYTFCQVASATKDSMVYRIWASSGTTINNVGIVIYVIGKWK